MLSKRGKTKTKKHTNNDRQNKQRLFLSQIPHLPSRLPVNDREGLPVMEGEKKWLIKNPSLVFSSASYAWARRVSFFSPISHSEFILPLSKAHVSAQTRLTAQIIFWQKWEKVAKFQTSGSQSACKLLIRSGEDLGLVLLTNFSTSVTPKRTRPPSFHIRSVDS